MKKNYEKFAKWLKNKGIFDNIPTSLVCIGGLILVTQSIL